MTLDAPPSHIGLNNSSTNSPSMPAIKTDESAIPATLDETSASFSSMTGEIPGPRISEATSIATDEIGVPEAPKSLHPRTDICNEDSLTTAAKIASRYNLDGQAPDDEPPSKRTKLESDISNERRKGVAPIKSQFLVKVAGTHQPIAASANDDAAEASLRANDRSQGNDKKREKSKGQNKAREFGSSRDERQLCPTRVLTAEFSPEYCKFEEKCKHEHDLRKYLKDYRREDLSTFGGNCPVWELKGNCERGWKCLFVKSHMEERQSEDGRNELVLLARDENGSLVLQTPKLDRSSEVGVLNIISPNAKYAMMKRTVQTPQADVYSKWLEVNGRDMLRISNIGKTVTSNGISVPITDEERKTKIENLRAQFTEPPFLPSEKRRIHFGPETPVLAPLTTQGNLPFRRLCVSMGAQLTYSEMAMSKPLVQGQGSEWALMKVHETEITPPRFDAKSIVTDYNNSRDLKFGAQISGSKPELVLKATAHLTQLCPYLRVIDLNCGCPIDLVYRSGAGAALLDSQPKLERIVRGMNAISGEIPITVKIRTGTSNEKPTALKLINRLVYGTTEMNELNSGVSGVAAITLHGRSRQQRYTKNANWEYISECAALIKRHVEKGYDLADTIREADPRYQSPDGKVYFVGNGDCYSHTDYHQHMENTGVDSVMVARGALIKPWIFEEIEKGQYLDKTATERLAIVEQFVRNGLETWGSDEMGVGTTRRFLLEWLSFAYRYVPVGLLEYLPPSLQDRAPAWRGRNELETLLGSDNYLDWIKISEMFLGPANKNFQFQPKHKSNSFEIQAEG